MVFIFSKMVINAFVNWSPFLNSKILTINHFLSQGEPIEMYKMYIDQINNLSQGGRYIINVDHDKI